MKFFPPVNKCFIFQDCKSAKCKYIKCILKDIEVNSNYFVKVKTRIWIGTFITVSNLGATLTAVWVFFYHRSLFSVPLTHWGARQATYQSTELTPSISVETTNPDLLLINPKLLPVGSF